MQAKVHKALFNSFGGKVVESGFSLLAAIVLARVLGPSIIGIFAIAMVFIGLSRVLCSLGTADAIIRTSNEKLFGSLLSSIFWLNFFVGLVLAIIFYFAVLYTGDMLFKQGSSDVISKLCWILVPAALINVPNALLEREIKFENIFIIKLIAYSFSTIFSIYLATEGWGLDALILQQYSIILISLLLALYFSRWSPSFVMRSDDLKSIMSFSAHLTISKMVNYFTKQGDVFLLSLFSSSAMVGIYSRGYQLTTSTLQLINGSIIKVFYPVIAAKRFDPKLMWNITSLAVTALSIMYSFLFWIIYHYANVIVLTLLGKDWLLVADLLPIFCIITFILGMASVFSQILKALGRGDLMLKITLVCSSITLGLFYIGVQFGIIGLALGYMVGSLILYLTVLLICGVLLGTSIIRILVINLLSALLFFLTSSFSTFAVAKMGFTGYLFPLGSFLILYFVSSVGCLITFYKGFGKFYDFSSYKQYVLR